MAETNIKFDWNAPREAEGYSYKILRAGQPRPYADSIKVIEIYTPSGLTKEEATAIAKNMNIGFNDDKVEWYHPRLTYFRETRDGVWEFEMVSAYTG